MINLSFSDAPLEHSGEGANCRYKILVIPNKWCIIWLNTIYLISVWNQSIHFQLRYLHEWSKIYRFLKTVSRVNYTHFIYNYYNSIFAKTINRQRSLKKLRIIEVRDFSRLYVRQPGPELYYISLHVFHYINIYISMSPSISTESVTLCTPCTYIIFTICLCYIPSVKVSVFPLDKAVHVPVNMLSRQGQDEFCWPVNKWLCVCKYAIFVLNQYV